jgi:hypothetical protein
MKTTVKSLSILLFIIVLTGCGRFGKPDDFDYGVVENGKYINTFFKCKMDLPSKWVIKDQNQRDSLMKEGSKEVAGDNARLKAALKVSEVNTANLLTAFQYEEDSVIIYNASFLLIAENVRNSGIKNGDDYLYATKKFLAKSEFKYDSIDENFTKEVIGGKDFYKMNATKNIGDVTVKQIYYSTVLKGFSFNAIISYVTDEQKEELQKSLMTLEFTD